MKDQFSFNPIEDSFDNLNKAIVSLFRTDDPLCEQFAEELIHIRERFKGKFEARDLEVDNVW